jgi:hypothetical protein
MIARVQLRRSSTGGSLSRQFAVGRGALLLLAFGGFLLRALIPAGFMPAPIGEGGPVVVCHAGLAGQMFARLAASRDGVGADHAGAHAAQGEHSAHAGHIDHASADVAADRDVLSDPAHEAWEQCPFGAAFGAALLASNFSPDLLALEHSLEIVEPSQPTAVRPISLYRARAPPSAAIHT